MSEAYAQLSLLPIEPMKWCYKCRQWLPLSAFTRHKSKIGGLREKCKACMAEYKRVYRAKNRDKILAYRRTYDAAHPDKVRAYSRAHYYRRHERLSQSDTARPRQKKGPEHHRAVKRRYYAANAERIKARVRKWDASHLEYRSIHHQRRRLQMLQIPVNDFTVAEWREMIEYFGHCCAYCGHYKERLTQDHIVAISLGGPHTASNIVPACRSCNSRKSVLGLAQFLLRQ